MPLIDSQVHIYEARSAQRPWRNGTNWPAHVTADEMAAALDAVGVDGAIVVSPFVLYGYDASLTVAAQRAHPGRFGIVKPVDPEDAAVAEVIAQWRETPGTVAVRIIMPKGAERDAQDPGLARIAQAAARHDLPVNLYCAGNLAGGTALIDRYPDTRFVLDHLGLEQPHEKPAPADPWRELPQVLALARRPNVVIKVSGACTLSHQPYPFADLWGPLAQVFEAWGLQRCLWGTDWTRTHAILSYREAVDAFRLNERLTTDELALLMGGACAQAYGWSPTPRGTSPATPSPTSRS